MDITPTLDDDKNREEKQEKNEDQKPKQQPSSSPALSPAALALSVRPRTEPTQLSYQHLNLNCGCPSDRVSGQGGFGASLMRDPNLVKDVMQALKDKAPEMKRSIKCRLGVDKEESFEFLENFIDVTSGLKDLGKEDGKKRVHDDEKGNDEKADAKENLVEGSKSPLVDTFFLHARKCLLNGLSPAQNRNIPPLNFRRIYQMCERFPELEFHLNGGVKSLKHAREIVYGKRVSDKMSEIPNINWEKAREIVEEEIAAEREHAVKQGESAATSDTPFLQSNLGLVGENPSTEAPQTIAPANLKGVMIGRLAMENVSLLWDIDRYFYGDKTNPCQTRRELLDKYAEYLDKLHPRQCKEDCEHCQERAESTGENGTNTTDDTLAQDPHRKRQKMKNIPSKIPTGTICRSMKPVLGLFTNVPGNRAFRRSLDELTRDMRIRDCGPGFILRRAMKLALPDGILDEPFKTTEEYEAEIEERARISKEKKLEREKLERESVCTVDSVESVEEDVGKNKNKGQEDGSLTPSGSTRSTVGEGSPTESVCGNDKMEVDNAVGEGGEKIVESQGDGGAGGLLEFEAKRRKGCCD